MKLRQLLLIPCCAASVALAQQPAAPVATPSAAPSATATPSPTASPSPVSADPAAAPAEELRVAKAEPVGERELAVRLQIFLDNNNFGPGKIDGRSKEFTLKAFGRYQKAKGMPVTAKLEDAVQLPLNSIEPIYTTYTITEADLLRVGDVPRKPEEQAKLKKMPYPSLLKFVAERYHSDPEFLAKINRGKDMEKLVAGDTLFVPNVPPFKIETIKEVGKLPPVPEFKRRTLKIDTKEKMLDLTEGDTILASFPITPGSDKLPAPAGTWRILGIATLPWFRHDEGVLNHGVRTSHYFNIPAGPSNPVGVLWCGLNRPGIGVHGTNQPFTIGRAASHGCIRLANWDAIRLSSMITEGMNVIIDGGVPLPKPGEKPSAAPVQKAEQKPPVAPEKKVSLNAPLTVGSQTATKNAPQIPGRETKYANH